MVPGIGTGKRFDAILTELMAVIPVHVDQREQKLNGFPNEYL